MLIAIVVVLAFLWLASVVVVGLLIRDTRNWNRELSSSLQAMNERLARLEKDKTDLRSFRDDITTMGKRIESIEAKPTHDDPSLAARVTDLEDGVARHVSAAQLGHDATKAGILKHADQIAGLQHWCGQLEKSQQSTADNLPLLVNNAVSSMLYRLATSVKDQPGA